MTPLTVQIHNMFSDQGPGLARELTTGILIGPAFNPDCVTPPPPHEQRLKAVWDTGATGTSITHSLAQAMNLDEIGEVEICGVTGNAVCKKYLVSLHLPNKVVIPELEVSDCEGNIGCDVLIGMDVITRGDFAICNWNGNTTFTFRMPSVEKIDFTQQVPRNSVGGFRFPQRPGRNSPCPCGSGKKFKYCCGKL